MKIKIKQVWDMKISGDMTLIQAKIIADAIRKTGDECYLAHDYNGDLIMRRVSQ